MVQTAGFEGKLWERDVRDVDFHLLKSMHFHHLYSRYNPKRCSDFSFIIESWWWNMAGMGFSIEAGRWGEMVKSVSSFLRAQINTTFLLTSALPKTAATSDT